MNRREFATASTFTIVPRHVLGGAGFIAPSDRLNIACIGMGRQGMEVMMVLLPRPDVQIVAVSDCNKGSKNYAEYSDNALLLTARKLLGPGYVKWGEDLASPGRLELTPSFSTSLGMGGREPAKRVVEAYYGSRRQDGSYKGCAAYADYRELLSKESGIDAVYIATPDHWHAPIAIAAMNKGKHVLGQKPMAHNIGEARRMAAVAKEKNVATAVAINNPTSEATKLLTSWIADGAIGTVREVHNWSIRPIWPQGIPRPKEMMPVPDGLDWDMWLGPAPERPFHTIYQPFVWRGWCDFGCGSYGDMGCYSFSGIFQVLRLTPPTAVEASTSEVWDETYPKASIVRLSFPENGGRAPVEMSWYDGGLRPKRPSGLIESQQRLFQRGGEGIIYSGDKGIIVAGFNGEAPQVYPESPKYKLRAEPAPETEGVFDQWIAACKGGPASPSDFITQAPVSEAFLLGCIAQRLPGERLVWDKAAMKITSSDAANRLVDPAYRGKWIS